jgi:tetratricopeptide (TPR) repeat protein
LAPDNADAHDHRAVARAAGRRYREAIEDYGEAIRLDPKHAAAYAHRARLLATCPDARFRDGARAVADARRACELTDWKNLEYLDTLGAAYAEAGDFSSAIEWQNKALALASASETFRQLARQRLDLYRAGKPYHEGPGR